MQLLKNEKFVAEYKEFQQRLSMVTDKKMKSEIDGLIVTLVAEVRCIDQYHQSLILGGKVSSMIDDSRDKIRDLRKKINRRLEDCERSGLFKSPTKT
jgi:hypothetical protein